MILNKSLLCIVIFFVVSGLTCRESIEFESDDILSIAFYNIDNLFDDVNDTSHDDDEFTPEGKYQWSSERYHLKLKNMEEVIRQIADDKAPDILGVCELESKKALSDLLKTGLLKGHYDLVHYDSPDERGIDVALVYNTDKVKVLESKNYRVKMQNNPSDKTRDILWIKALSKKNNDTLQLIVCHFPSRREGKQKSEQDRLDAAQVCQSIIKDRCSLNTQNLVIMGDFNDEPWDKSISQILEAKDIQRFPGHELLNLMWHFKEDKRGSYNYKNHWEALDQMMLSKALTDGKGMEYITGSVNIMEKDWMMQSGKYEGYPLRTFGGIKWLNGYSDHLPVYIKIKI